MTAILDFYRTDPLVAWTLTVGLLSLFVACLYAVWLSNEEKKAADRERARKRELERVMRVTHDLGKRGPAGFGNRRAS